MSKTAPAVLVADEAFLSKPFTPAGLLEAVNLLLCGTVKKPATKQSQGT